MKLMKTYSNRTIEQFAKNVEWVHYEYCQLYKPDIEGAQGILASGGACDEVFKDNTAQDTLRDKDGYDLFLVFGGGEDRLYVRMKDGEAFYNNCPVLLLGVLDEDDIKVLVPIYNKFYLDRWAKNYAEDVVSKSMVGIHDEFTRVAQNIYNNFHCDFPGVDCLRKVDWFDIVKENKQLRFSKAYDEKAEVLVFD